jgi:hypothetical protein
MPKSNPKLPKWANERLKFQFNPDDALAKGAHAKPKKTRAKRK